MKGEKQANTVRVRPYIAADRWEAIQAIARRNECTDSEALAAVLRLGLDAADRLGWVDVRRGEQANNQMLIKAVARLKLCHSLIDYLGGRLQV